MIRRLLFIGALLLCIQGVAAAQVSAGGVSVVTTCGTVSGGIFSSQAYRNGLYCQNIGQGPGPVYICIGTGATGCTAATGLALYPGYDTPASWVNSNAAPNSGISLGIPKGDVDCIADTASQPVVCIQD
jgi:hypothetical protein